MPQPPLHDVVRDHLQQHGVTHPAVVADVNAMLAHPIVSKLTTLMNNPTPAAVAEGDQRLRATLATVLALAEHVKAQPGVTPSPLLTATLAGLPPILATK